jgi:hypothetical protein
MNKQRLKLLLWLFIGLLLVSALLLALSRLSQLVAYFQEGADPASALNIVPNVPPDLQTRLVWLADDADTGREMEPLTRRQIEAAYLRAWLQWNLSFERGQPFGLQTYFAGPALDAVRANVAEIAAQGWRVNQVDTEHILQLHFYAADGSIVAFTDRAANVAQIVTDGQGNAIQAGETTRGYEVVMFLEDGNWRVRHWRRTAASAPGTQAEGREDLATARVADGRLMLGDQVFHCWTGPRWLICR